MGKIKIVHLRDQDAEIIAYLDGLKNFSEWVRQKALSDIARQKTGLTPDLAAYIDQAVELRLTGRRVYVKKAYGEVQESDNTVKDDIERMF